ncbi:MAG TPA: sugar phosphate isomerase/epimerase [Chloroflexota bacterium]|jgi:sugar phosphate isomerase/epimerase|nr:sugar phosphate isomerase/epimerase [Chloroflexota bacterium]
MPLSQNIGINLFGRLDPLDGMRRIAAAGYDAIDYSAIGRHATAGSSLAMALRVLAAELGLLPAALHFRSFGFDFLGSPEASDRFRAASLEDVGLAAELDAPAIAFHLGNDLPGASDEQLAAANAAVLGPAVALAGDLGVAIALENHCHGWGDQFAHLALVADALAAGNVGYCCDSGHAVVAGVDPPTLIAAMGSRLRLIHLHSNDGRRDIHRPAGEGVLHWPPLLAALERLGYAGAMLLEGGLHLPGDDIDALLAAHLRGFRTVLAMYAH